MYRPTSAIANQGRPAETDMGLLALAVIVIVLLLLVAGLGGLVVWQWRQAEQARRMAEAAELQARDAEMIARLQELRLRDLTRPDMAPNDLLEPAVQHSMRAGALAAMPAMNPWPLLPLLVDSSAR